ncbi:MAG: hypothetical protein ACQET1_11610, partial [Gemmatimonadota bacterium]
MAIIATGWSDELVSCSNLPEPIDLLEGFLYPGVTGDHAGGSPGTMGQVVSSPGHNREDQDGNQ